MCPDTCKGSTPAVPGRRLTARCSGRRLRAAAERVIVSQTAMAYFADLDTTTQITRGPHVRAIGWLSAKHTYPRGSSSAAFIDRLRSLCQRWIESVGALDWPVAAGPHTCELCNQFRASGYIGVPAGEALFVAPEMVAHYVEQHGYLPPEEFVDAVLASPAPGTTDYADAVKPFVAGSAG